ncbi:MAG: methylmalonyl-CoA mutase family protein, partial [Pseudomonadales bacterium]
MSEAKMKSVPGKTRPAPQQPPLRFVTAASLFDGHDASINIMRRILQSLGVEVIHLAHNRSVAEVVQAALQEDVQGIAISSYQGGHVEYFKYVVDMLKEHDASHIKVFGGGGGVIVPEEIRELHDYGVTRIYSPEDGMTLGLVGMIQDMVELSTNATSATNAQSTTEQPSRKQRQQMDAAPNDHDYLALARLITAIERGEMSAKDLAALKLGTDSSTPVLGITGTGGAGKSSLTDEIIRRFRTDSGDSVKVAVLAIDPTRRKTGGALLGDRIRMNAIYAPNIFMRSIATRHSKGEVPDCLTEIIAAARGFDFDLIVVETPGIGQGDAGIVPYVDASMYVMTPEFGAQSQLEKIDMLDFADLVVINKFDRKGAEDALRDVAKQVQRNRGNFDLAPHDMPVYGTIASRFGDDGVSSAYHGLLKVLRQKGLREWPSALPHRDEKLPSERAVVVPVARQRYLAEIAETVRAYHADSLQQAQLARERGQLNATQQMLDAPNEQVQTLLEKRTDKLSIENRKLLEDWPTVKASFEGKERQETTPTGKEVSTALGTESLSGTWVPRVALPPYQDEGEILKFLKKENLPGVFPFTAGVFPFKREGEDPARMFAGEGDPARTNLRFKKLSEHSAAKRLSTAFDSVTLYGFDPATRPDIYGKIGNSGVSIATLDDMKTLYDGFDLCNPATSVSMTINGPAPAILAMFLNTAIDQQLAKFRAKES